MIFKYQINKIYIVLKKDMSVVLQFLYPDLQHEIFLFNVPCKQEHTTPS